MDEDNEKVEKVKLPIPLLKPFVFRTPGKWSDGLDQHGIWEIASVKDLGTYKAKCTIRRVATARAACPIGQTASFWLDGFGERIARTDYNSFNAKE